MTLISATLFKAQIDAAATALTTAFDEDGVATGMATEVSNPSHPLRRIEKLFNFNPQTGVFTTDASYIDDCYAGRTPNKGNPNDVIADPPV